MVQSEILTLICPVADKMYLIINSECRLRSNSESLTKFMILLRSQTFVSSDDCIDICRDDI